METTQKQTKTCTVAILFMIISSMPLMLIFVSIERRSINFFKMDQVFWFLLIILLFGVVIMAKSYSQNKSLSFSVFVQCLFYTISSITTTGFGLEGVGVAKNSVIAVLHHVLSDSAKYSQMHPRLKPRT